MEGQWKTQLMKLQNGSDVRGIAMEGIGGEHTNLTAEHACSIGGAFGKWLMKKLGKKQVKIGVGRDSRLTGESLTSAVLSGLAQNGVEIFDCGMASTPSMFMSTQFARTDFDGSVMITASHLPFNRNGLKFFTKEGGLDKPDITALLELAADGEILQPSAVSSCEKVDLISMYGAFLREKILMGTSAGEKPLAGMHVVVDAGNGAGGFFVTQVLEPLGADVSGSQFLEPDGAFPNHEPNPENKQAVAAIQEAVKKNGAELGLIFDTDVDRMSAVLGDGTIVNRDAIIGMMAAIVAPDAPGGYIVTDSVTSHTLTDFLENRLGLHHHRFKRGYKNVINECMRLNREGTLSPLAIETSGHGALKENFYLDDGAYMAVKLLVAAANLKKQGKTAEGLLEGYVPAFESREYRLKLLDEDFKGYGQKVLEAFEQRAKEQGISVAPNSFEGVRLEFSQPECTGWALLRLSLHDPLMPLNLEGDAAGQCDVILSKVKELLSGFDKLDVSVLK